MSLRCAFITGGSRGIGGAVAVRLSRDGFHVIINYRAHHEQASALLDSIKERGGSGELAPFDITDRISARNNIESILSIHRLSVCVHCAGIRDDELFVFMKEEQWDGLLQTNLTSFYTVLQPVVKQMLLHHEGRIVVLSSTSGQAGVVGQVHYSAAKAGLLGAVKALARECAKKNVLVNAIAAGFITTEMTKSLNERKLIEDIPMKRFGKPEEVAGLVSFLASDDASYITGQVIGINGGIYM